MFYPGKKFGPYTLLTKLARGGFGEVWLAEKQSPLVTKKVAVKLPHDEQIDFETIKREAQLWEEASGHPNVLPLVDADLYDGQVVIVSEYIEEGSLADKLKAEGTLSVRQAVEITIGILNGLEFLHSKNIVHRDVKPANILMQNDVPRLADFGISRALQVTSVSSKIVGTETFMSPESFEGVRSMQTDIWSVGVVLFKLLSGYLPFYGTAPVETMYAILTKSPEPLPDEIPERLKEIVYKALEKDRELKDEPARRYQTAAEMREELRAFLETYTEPVAAAVAAAANQPTQALQSPPPPTLVQSLSEDSRATRIKMRVPLAASSLGISSKAVLFLVLGVSGVIALIFIYLFSQSPSSEIAVVPDGSGGSERTNVNNSANNLPDGAIKRSKELYREGDKLYGQKKYAEAVETYSKAIELNPNDFGLYNNRAIAYQALSEYEKAINDYTKAIELNPYHFSGYNNRGAAYEDIGNIEQAINDFRKALELDPDNKTAKNNLKRILK